MTPDPSRLRSIDTEDSLVVLSTFAILISLTSSRFCFNQLTLITSLYDFIFVLKATTRREVDAAHSGRPRSLPHDQ